MRPLASRSTLPIGVFDSGLGGLTVVKEINRYLPHENLIYVGDTARVPYGAKSPETIRKYAFQISFFLLQKKVKALVVACNSVSAVALPFLKRLPVPVLGVIEPGARAMARGTRVGRVGVIGTQATVSSHSYKKALRKISPRLNVIEQACPLFVPLVEEGWLNTLVTRRVAQTYLDPLIKKKVDSIVLGCTHYPLLKNTIQGIVGKNVRLIDSAEETARDLLLLLNRYNLKNPSRRAGNTSFFVTDHPSTFVKLGRQFLGRRSIPARQLSLENI